MSAVGFVQKTGAVIRLREAFSAGSACAYRIYTEATRAGISCDDAETLLAKGIITLKEKVKFDKLPDDRADRILLDCKKAGIRPICISDADYPETLRNIQVPPLVLYTKGSFIDADSEPMFCIVGPREVSQFGAKAAYSLSVRLARGGFVIVSGGALGCDTYAHLGALKAGGRTVAVLGCGIESDYLYQNKRLRQRIAETGCLVSEYPPYEKPTKYSFPIRNRLLSGLSLGTAVIEAGERSGALITARNACEQGRDVFVIPGNPTLQHYKGSNALFYDGAKPLTKAKDIFDEYIARFPDKIDLEKAFETVKSPHDTKIIKKLKEGLSKEAEIVYNNLDKQKFTADDLEGTGLDADMLLSALTELEMEHLIEALPGGMYAVCGI